VTMLWWAPPLLYISGCSNTSSRCLHILFTPLYFGSCGLIAKTSFIFAGPEFFLFHHTWSCLDTFHKIEPSFYSFCIIYITSVLKLEPLRDASLSEILCGYHLSPVAKIRIRTLGTGSGSNATHL
jgi:hypothetical protein